MTPSKVSACACIGAIVWVYFVINGAVVNWSPGLTLRLTLRLLMLCVVCLFVCGLLSPVSTSPFIRFLKSDNEDILEATSRVISHLSGQGDTKRKYSFPCEGQATPVSVTMREFVMFVGVPSFWGKPHAIERCVGGAAKSDSRLSQPFLLMALVYCLNAPV